MNSFQGLVFATLLLFISVHDTVGINCYVCAGDSRCNDPFDKGNNTDRIALSSGGWCWKGIGERDNKTIIGRGAAPIKDGAQTIGCTENKCRKETILGGSGDFCCCNTDLCNSAARITMTGSIFLTILLFMIRY